MNKFVRFLSLILSVVMSFSLFTACDGGKETDNQTNVATKVVNTSRVDVYNFEQWKPDFACIKGQKLFGVVKRNKDKQYCKSGDYSCKIMPIGGHIEASAPILWFPFSSSSWDFDYRDFSYVDCVTLWMYNDNDVEKDVVIGLVNKYLGFERITRLQGQTFSLKPKEWTLIKYIIDFGSMTIGSDVDRDDMISIQGLYMEYETAVSPKVEEAPVFYADDISLHYKETINGFVSPLSFDANAEIKYLVNFDEIWHNNLSFIKITKPISAPSQRIVNSSDVGVEATSGSRMLKFSFPLMKKSDGHEQAWHRWLLPEQLMREFWKTYIYNGELENPYIVPRNEWKDWYFCYDVYNASDFTFNLSLKFFVSGDKWANAGSSTTMTPGEWRTVKISVDTLASDINKMSSWTDKNGNSLKPAEYYLNEDRITNPGSLWITFDSAPTTKDAEGNTVDLVSENFTRMNYYFDSFRLVHIA